MSRSRPQQMLRCAANLLFEYRVTRSPSRRPLCEKQIVTFSATSPRDAVQRARRRGKQAEHAYRNADGQTVRFRFVGLIDVITLEACADDEVYYSLRRMQDPRRQVQPDARLSVMAAPKPVGSAWRAVPASHAAPRANRTRRR